jgi:hypothetical protein
MTSMDNKWTSSRSSYLFASDYATFPDKGDKPSDPIPTDSRKQTSYPPSSTHSVSCNKSDIYNYINTTR